MLMTTRNGPPPLARRDRSREPIRGTGVRTTSARAERPAGCSGPGGGGSDHLRSRGETWDVPDEDGKGYGPPPLARRDPGAGQDADAADRTTSARAERPGGPGAPGSAPSDHLRSRGETVRSNSNVSARTGPPPLARRDPPDPGKPAGQRRTTSARAERPRTAGPLDATRTDHLRSRGETGDRDKALTLTGGPPPLARRDRRHPASPGPQGRTTSARAERPWRMTGAMSWGSDHLRSRGETGRSSPGTSYRTGPPPLARRDQMQAFVDTLRVRTTSARAERPPHRRRRRASRPDHLRSRGETAGVWTASRISAGPPPLARRDLQVAREDRPLPRTTSARAERPTSTPARREPTPDHLRSRGETVDLIAPIEDPRGPPPLARRDRARQPRSAEDHRTTSARAERPGGGGEVAGARPDHLRSRGETQARAEADGNNAGPPPLARRDRYCAVRAARM